MGADGHLYIFSRINVMKKFEDDPSLMEFVLDLMNRVINTKIPSRAYENFATGFEDGVDFVDNINKTYPWPDYIVGYADFGSCNDYFLYGIEGDENLVESDYDYDIVARLYRILYDVDETDSEWKLERWMKMKCEDVLKEFEIDSIQMWT